MAAATSIDDAKRFLFLHPWSTTDLDNPVELLESVVHDFDAVLAAVTREASNDDDDDGRSAGDGEYESGRVDKLMAFVKKLRDERKISEAEYQSALQYAG